MTFSILANLKLNLHISLPSNKMCQTSKWNLIEFYSAQSNITLFNIVSFIIPADKPFIALMHTNKVMAVYLLVAYFAQ